MTVVGDSKSVGGTWPDQLIGRLPNFGEDPARMAVSGITTYTMKTNIDGYLSTRAGNPRFICINLGVNEVSGVAGYTNEWKAACAYILDALHAKYPAAQIYWARMWTRGWETNMNLVDDVLIPAVLASRSQWASVGIDEREIIEGGDNGATYTTDGVHPNTAGYLLEAAAWETLLGY